MNWKLYILMIVVGIISCNKFEHESFEVPNCEFCDYAETLEGTYRGLAYGISVPNYSDSMTMTLEQIFLGNSQYEDSTFIHFRVYYDYDSLADIQTGTMRLENGNGVDQYGGYLLTPDSIVLSYDGQTSTTTYGPVLHGTFYRQ